MSYIKDRVQSLRSQIAVYSKREIHDVRNSSDYGQLRYRFLHATTPAPLRVVVVVYGLEGVTSSFDRGRPKCSAGIYRRQADGIAMPRHQFRCVDRDYVLFEVAIVFCLEKFA